MRQWAIAIGINQYEHLQPLRYAQHDAQALLHELVFSAGFPPNQCLLLSDTSPPFDLRATHPTRDTIFSWLDWLRQTAIQAGDLVWFFFSGYGLCYQKQDYLVPSDGDPAAIAYTGIPVADLFGALEALPAETVLVLLDMNRNQSARFREVVGIQTARLSGQSGISTILSCRSGQFSREVSSLRHGLFTSALLESIRYHQATTLTQLSRYLERRLPELSDHHLQPNQQPLIIAAPQSLRQPILPYHAGFSLWNASGLNDAIAQAGAPQSVAVGAATGSRQSNQYRVSESGVGTVVTISPPTARTGGYYDRGNLQPLDRRFAIDSLQQGIRPIGNGQGAGNSMTSQSRSNSTQPPPTGEESDASDFQQIGQDDVWVWRSLLIGGGVLAVLLLVGVGMRHKASFTTGSQPSRNQPNTTTKPQTVTTQSPSATIPPGSEPNPPSQSTELTSTAPVSQPDGSLGAEESLLMMARMENGISQATPYARAIQLVSQISQQHPDYQKAQGQIVLWSQEILAIAEQRADQRQFDIAIMAAALITPSQDNAYSQAQDLLREWCPLIADLPADSATRRQAKAICGQ